MLHNSTFVKQWAYDTLFPDSPTLTQYIDLLD